LAWLSGKSRVLAPSLAKTGVSLVLACILWQGAWAALNTPYAPHDISEFRGLWRGVLVVVVSVSAVLYGWWISVMHEELTSRH
jgi:hypothetical protein